MAVITFLSDFGTADGYVGAMKGVALSSAPDATLVDIAHDVPAHDIAAGAFALAQAAPYFPKGTVHVAVVDPGVGGARSGVAVESGGQLFVGPDNGLLTIAAPAPRRAFAIENPHFRRSELSNTFHGRDLFAVTAGRLATGSVASDAGPEVVLAEISVPAGAQAEPTSLTADAFGLARVVHVDSFGNLITDRCGAALPEGVRFRAAGHAIAGLSTTYESVARGELLATVGSSGALEVAVREGSAAELLGIGRGDWIDILRRPAES